MRHPVARHTLALGLVVSSAVAAGAGIAACGFQVSSGVGLGGDAGTDASSGDDAPTGCGLLGCPDAPTESGDDALVTDAATDGGLIAVDALPIPDAMLDAPVNTTPCGAINEACCSNGPGCKPGGECNSNNTCASCGNLFESCCSTGPACNTLTTCVGGTCVGL